MKHCLQVPQKDSDASKDVPQVLYSEDTPESAT